MARTPYSFAKYQREEKKRKRKREKEEKLKARKAQKDGEDPEGASSTEPGEAATPEESDQDPTAAPDTPPHQD